MKQGHLLLIVLLIGIPTIAISQNKTVLDSLVRLAEQQDDSTKVWTLTQVSWQWRQYNLSKSLQYAQEALTLARHRNDPEQIGFCWMTIGNVYSYHRQTAEALTAYRNAEGYLIKSPDVRRSHRQAQLQVNIGLLYHEQLNEDAKATNAYLIAARFHEKDQNWAGLSDCYRVVGNLLMHQKAESQAENYYQKALAMAHRSQDPQEEAAVYNDFFSSYITRYKNRPDQALLLKAIHGFREGIALCRKYESQIPPQYLPTLQSNLGECYFLDQKPDSARLLLTESLRLAAPINYMAVVSINHALLAQIDFGRGDTGSAQRHLAEAERYYGDLDWENQQVVARQLSDVSAGQQQWADAFRWQKRYQAVSDSLSDQERNRTIASLNLRYDVERKDIQIAALQQETTNQRNIIGLAIILGLALLALAWAGFRLLRVQRQLNAGQQGDFDAKMSQKERELMTHTLNLGTKNTLLHDLRKTLENHPDAKAVLRLIDQNIQSDDEVDNFRQHFEAVHPQFFRHLQQHAQQPLSTIDMRYCAYLRMGLTTKEIANLLNIDPASIRVAKYRLKQKVGLDKETDLDAFLKNL